MAGNVQLEVRKEDFEDILAIKPVHRSLEDKIVHGLGLSDEDKKAKDDILSAIPKVVAKKVEKNAPKGFKLSTIQLTFEVSGEPFGIGVKGDVQVTFTKGKAGK